MSTGFACTFTETKPGEWWYVLQNGDCPVGAWDWREFATAYGPFATCDLGSEHLRANHANPGGYSVSPYEEGREPDQTMQRLMDEAGERAKRALAARNRNSWLYR